MVSNKISFGKQDFKYFISYKDSKEIRPLCIFFPEMSKHKIYSDKTKFMYFMIKEEKNFDKYMTICEKVCNIMKKINSELVYNKKCLKAEKDSTEKNFFDVFI